MKLTYEQKLEIYRERKEEFYSWSMLTLKWNCSRSVLDYMIKLMDCHGVEIVKHKYTDYPNQYKKEAINRVLIDDESIREVSIQLGLSNIGTLTRWIKEYKANGYNIIKKKRGRHAHANQEETDIRRIGERECRASPEELAAYHRERICKKIALFKISADLSPECQILYSRNDIHHYHIGKR